MVASSRLPTHNIIPHTSLHDQPCHKTMKKYEDFEGMVISLLLSWGNSRFEHGSVIVLNIFAYFTLSRCLERLWWGRRFSPEARDTSGPVQWGRLSIGTRRFSTSFAARRWVASCGESLDRATRTCPDPSLILSHWVPSGFLSFPPAVCLFAGFPAHASCPCPSWHSWAVALERWEPGAVPAPSPSILWRSALICCARTSYSCLLRLTFDPRSLRSAVARTTRNSRRRPLRVPRFFGIQMRGWPRPEETG